MKKRVYKDIAWGYVAPRGKRDAGQFLIIILNLIRNC